LQHQPPKKTKDMKKSLLVLAFIFGYASVHAQWNGYPYQDVHGHHYKKQENLFKDQDQDGVSNIYDFNDKNPNVKFTNQPDYSVPSYYENYKSSYYDSNRNKNIYVGPRGGRYYINKNGSKTYIRKKHTNY